jgi:hypothetical protein
MTTALERRIAEIERMLAELAPNSTDHRRDPFEMTDVECVAAVYRFCHRHPPGWQGPKPDPAEEARIIAEWRRLTG